ncbi:MAG: phosphodiester glycosidase family protein [Aristaeellaceae bacterium]
MHARLVAGLLTVLFSVATMQWTWQQPCVGEPHAYAYQDENRAIAINIMEVDKSVVYVADVQLRSVSGFHTARTDKGTDRLTTLVKDTDAVLAVNADNFRSHGYGVIIREGECLRQNRSTRQLLAVCRDGAFEAVTDRRGEPAAELARRLTAQGALHTFEFGPLLVEDGEPVAFPTSFRLISTSPHRREPRTAIGMISPLHYMIVVVDGRKPGYSEGVSLQTLQQIFVELGAQTAFNLDGGGSTELWFQGEIINRPSGGGERSMSDCIWF